MYFFFIYYLKLIECFFLKEVCVIMDKNNIEVISNTSSNNIVLKYLLLEDKSKINNEKFTTNTSPNKLKHILVEIDWAISRFFTRLVQVCGLLIILTASILFLCVILTGFIEYRDGLFDISTTEILFVLFGWLLVKRYLAYCKLTSLPWWKIITTPIAWLGCFFILILLFGLFFQYTQLISDSSIIGYENLSQLFLFGVVLLSLYISVPSKRLKITMNNQEKTNNTDNKMSESKTIINPSGI